MKKYDFRIEGDDGWVTYDDIEAGSLKEADELMRRRYGQKYHILHVELNSSPQQGETAEVVIELPKSRTKDEVGLKPVFKLTEG